MEKQVRLIFSMSMILCRLTCLPLALLVHRRDLAEVGWFAVIMGLISGCTLLIPKAYFDIYGGFDASMRAVNDYEQWFRMFKDKKLVYVDKSLVGSRVHEGQVTSTYQGMRDEENCLNGWIPPDWIVSVPP